MSRESDGGEDGILTQHAGSAFAQRQPERALEANAFLMTYTDAPLSPQKIQEFINNNPVQKSLREEVEELYQQNQELKTKNNQLIQQVYSKTSGTGGGAGGEVDTQGQNDKLKAQL